MSAPYDAALIELHQAPLGQFIAERKRLVGNLKAAGEKTGARVLGQRPRPPVSAWAVNQLWWHAREAFDELLSTADRVRKGDLKASASHRDAIQKLRQRAAAILTDGGHNANEATLRRVHTTLSAIAATGGFGDDPPGTLPDDRDPPGFEAVGIPNAPIDGAPAAKPKLAVAPKDELAEARAKKAAKKVDEDEGAIDDADPDAPDEPEEKEESAADRAERVKREREEERARKAEEEADRKRVVAERHRLEAAMRTAKTELNDREREARAIQKQFEDATRKVDSAKAVVAGLEKQLDDLRNE